MQITLIPSHLVLFHTSLILFIFYNSLSSVCLSFYCSPLQLSYLYYYLIIFIVILSQLCQFPPLSSSAHPMPSPTVDPHTIVHICGPITLVLCLVPSPTYLSFCIVKSATYTTRGIFVSYNVVSFFRSLI